MYSHQHFVCVQGYYCPSSSEAIICPSGYYCKAGGVRPRGCNFISQCSEGSSAPVMWAGGIAAICILFFGLFTVYYLLKWWEKRSFSSQDRLTRDRAKRASLSRIKHRASVSRVFPV